MQSAKFKIQNGLKQRVVSNLSLFFREFKEFKEFREFREFKDSPIIP